MKFLRLNHSRYKIKFIEGAPVWSALNSFMPYPVIQLIWAVGQALSVVGCVAVQAQSCGVETGFGGGVVVSTQDKFPDAPPKILWLPLSSDKIVFLSRLNFETPTFVFFMFGNFEMHSPVFSLVAVPWGGCSAASGQDIQLLIVGEHPFINRIRKAISVWFWRESLLQETTEI